MATKYPTQVKPDKNAGLGGGGPIPNAKPERQKWEYKQLDCAGGATRDELNHPGIEGWELVGMALNACDVFTYVFKRPL